MHPEWVRSTVIGQTCDACDTELQADAIVGVATKIVTHKGKNLGGPICHVLLRCRGCGRHQYRRTIATQDEMIDAVHSIYRLANCMPDRRPTDRTKKRKAAAELFGHLDDVKPRVRPSIRRWSPRHPPTEKEIRIFLNKLRKTSMKVGTKSLARFLKALRPSENR